MKKLFISILIILLASGSVWAIPSSAPQPASSGGGITGTLTVTSLVTNFPAATAGQTYLVETSDGNPAWLGADGEPFPVAGTGLVVNTGDLLVCIADTAAGYYSSVGQNWNHDPRLISNPDGYRYVEIASNTSAPVMVTNGYYWLNNVMYKIENAVHSRVPSYQTQKIAVFSFSGGGSDIPDNTKVDSYIPAAATITGVVMTASDASACDSVIDVWSQAYADFPPEAAQKITASAPPTLSSALMSKDTTLTGWTTAVAADSILRANVTSNTCTGTVTVTVFGTVP